ncbi:MAG: SAM-dependent methyltransferase [Alphaproteobacteria bacterium]|nr:SAM-dependent methyltransferase [Alphaproteobacteria bacterium]
MTDMALGVLWSQRFGLARSPMFTFEKDGADGDHNVLLDGGYGSFGLSVVEERMDPVAAAGWAWSSDLPHHVTVSKKDVQVVRWDASSDAQVYSLDSVNRDLDGFYRFLCRDRLRSNRTVVQHLVNLFGRVRSLVAHARLPDDRAIDAFVTILGDLIAGENAPADTVGFGLPDDAAELRAALAGPSLEESLRDIRTAPTTLSAITLHPSLAIRHAGGQLFQEAHFDLVRAPPPDMFGYVDTATAERNSRGGTHFTPPALARSIVDHTILQIDDLADRPKLTISDPACGSAAFLHEALRGLQRVGFNGAVHVVGRDISRPAIAMARFTLTLALRDWTPAGGAALDLEIGDSLAEPAFPAADMTVMNPPFISVISQTPEQKVQLRAVIGDKAGSRGDYSMAFVTRALDALADRGAMGTLFPANLLTHEAATPWREKLASEGDIRLLASIGDFGLFSQALVHVACAVIAKGQPHRREFTALVTGNEAGATGDALRELRKIHGMPPAIAVGDRQWKLFATEASVLDRKLPWRILTPQQRGLLDALEAAQTPTVGSLFDIAQGVQTGNLKVFLFDDAAFRRLGLPAKEKRHFREALMTDSIENGRIIKKYHLFFPHGRDGSLFASEEELAAAVPTYYRAILKPNEAVLKGRASILQANRTDWWGLMRSRTSTFSLDDRPRIVSKFFGAEGSFALDASGRYLPSTGHIWTPKRELLASRLDEHEDIDPAEEIGEGVREAASIEVLHAYVALLNSRTFVRLVSFRSVTIAGGQFDLSSRFLAPVFLPDLWEKAEDPILGGHVRRLARVTIAAERGEPVHADNVDRLVAQLYGVPELVED